MGFGMLNINHKFSREVSPKTAEGGAWREVEGVWRILFGGLGEYGLSIEWHDFRVDRGLDWGRSFHPLSLEVCLNMHGAAEIGSRGGSLSIESGEVAVYSIGESPVRAVRRAGGRHAFFTLEVTPAYLTENFRFVSGGLRRCIREFAGQPSSADPVLMKFPLPAQLLGLRTQLLEPPVPELAREFWYQGKVMEVFSHALFCPGEPSELFCERQRRLNRERCERVLFLLERDMENPPSLEMLAEEVGCSPFYLSRTFAEIMGASIRATLRRLRIERAARHLLDGKGNVTEVAIQVGYASLGAFNKAFLDHHGCSPSQFLKNHAATVH
jgi:AraC family transcriptional regulator